MKHRTFLGFILPAATAMLLFIALPIASVPIRSVYAPQEQVLAEAWARADGLGASWQRRQSLPFTVPRPSP